MLNTNRLLVSTALSVIAWSTPAFATDPPDFSMIDQFGIDQLTTRLNLWKPILTVGPLGGENLTYAWNFSYLPNYSGATSQASPQDNFTYYLTGSSTGTGGVGVVLSDVSKTFTCTNYVCTPDAGDGTTLTHSGTSYTYTGSDGTVVTFNASSTYVRPLPYNQAIGFATKIVKPNGYTVNITYSFAHFNYSTQTYWIIRPSSINDSNGYQIKLTYNNTSPSYSSWADSARPIQVMGINNAVDYCSPTLTCSGFTQSWPTSTLNFGNTTSVTDARGNVTTYVYSLYLQSITPPGYSSPSVTYGSTATAQTVTSAGQTWTYTLSTGSPASVTIASPTGATKTIVRAASTFNRPASITDGLGHTTNYLYDGQGRLTYLVPPEGTISGGVPTAGYTQFTYDGRGNLTQTTKVSKTPGSPANVVTTANYDPTCANAVKCNQPNWTRDANGNETDYSYDPTSGLLTKVTQPAPTAGAIQPVITYSYTSLQGYYKNSAGSIVASGMPVNKVTGISTCRSTASCLGTSDETRTTINFGPQSAGTANNLLPVSKTSQSGDYPAAGSVGATTGASYDIVGNVASVTDPNGNTTTAFYDANRNPLGTIGPDPDGAGPLLPRSTRATYRPDNQVSLVEQGTATSNSLASFNAMTTLQSQGTGYDSYGRKATTDRKSVV